MGITCDSFWCIASVALRRRGTDFCVCFAAANIVIDWFWLDGVHRCGVLGVEMGVMGGVRSGWGPLFCGYVRSRRLTSDPQVWEPHHKFLIWTLSLRPRSSDRPRKRVGGAHADPQV